MGQQESSQKELIAQQFNIVRTISPGEYWVRRKKKGDELQLRLLTFYLQEEMQEYMRLLDRRKKIKNPHLLELIQHTKIHEQGMCSAAFKIRTLVQYPFKSIRDEIQERSSAHPKRFFSEDQMWSILYSCCHALYTLYLNKFNHQSLNTNQIFIDTAGIIKIADNVLVNCQKNHLSLLNESSAESTARYISPELVNLVEDNHFYFYEKEKSDVFILAMIMLQVANLEVIRYYHKKTKKFNFDQSTKARLQAQSRYSRQLTELLDSMLALDFKLRPRFEDIIAAIQQKTVYTGSSANTSLMSNEAKSNKTATIPKNGKQVDSYLNNYDYQKHERNWSLPPSNIAGSELNPTFSHFVPKTHKQYPQIIPTDSVFKFQPNRIDNFITYPIRNQSQFKHEANGPIKEATRTLPVATDTYKRDQSVTNKVQTWKIDTVFRDSGQKNQEAYTPYLQLLNLTQKTDLNKPTSNFNVAKVETVVSQPSQKPKISIKLNNSPIKNQNQVIPQVQQPFPNQLQLKPLQNLRFSQSKFGKIELPSGVVNPNTNQNLIHIQKQTQIAQVNPFQSTQVNGEGTFIIQQYEQGKFQGFKVNNKRNGVGRFIYLNGSYYQGEWKNDTIDGFGKLYYTNGQTAYEGHWRNFTFQGTGKLHNENPKITNISPIDYTDLSSIEDRWVDYEGEFSNDEKHGRGTILLANGQIFTGVFQRDVAQGEGSYYKLNGEVIQGRWAKNLYIGGL